MSIILEKGYDHKEEAIKEMTAFIEENFERIASSTWYPNRVKLRLELR